MNVKWRIAISIIVLAMVSGIGISVVSAAPVVDGNSQSFAGEWTDDQECGDGDPVGDIPNLGSGYDLVAVYQQYDPATDTLYFRIDVAGMPADLDDNGDTDTVCAIPPGDCAGVGPYEQYSIVLDSTTQIIYQGNAVTVNPSGSATAAYGDGGPNGCIEFALDAASTHVNPYDYCLAVTAGGSGDSIEGQPIGEDLYQCCFEEEAELDFDWEDACCKRQDFEGTIVSGIFDENEWEWDFGAGANPATSTLLDPGVVEYDTCGTKTVSLTGKTTSGQTVTVTKSIHVACDPTAIARANGATGTLWLDDCSDQVTFDGTSSHVDPASSGRSISRYEWVIPGHGTFNTATVGPLSVADGTTATLTVWDQTTATGEEHCQGTATVTVRCSPEVPALTPIGAMLLVGMIAALGAAAIVLRRRD
ncbi:MAG: hypothetical protein ACXQS6_05690 [Candidatus Syntropharchaeales archaeon]